MKCHFSFLGVIYGLIMVRKPDISFLHIVLFFIALFVMIFIESWALGKLKKKKELYAILNGLVFLIMALMAATLYTDILTDKFGYVLLGGTLFSMGCVYFPIKYRQDIDDEKSEITN